MMQNFYQPYYPQYQPYTQPAQDNLSALRQQYQAPMLPTQMSGTNDERIWVQGEDAAKAYLMAPNSFVRLWDATDSIFYEKRTDQTGKPYMDTYTYEKMPEMAPLTASERKGREGIVEKLNALERRISALEKENENDTEPDAVDAGFHAI